jgi:TRAP-type C4-dicarboxylate transport system substrate-binding protein
MRKHTFFRFIGPFLFALFICGYSPVLFAADAVKPIKLRFSHPVPLMTVMHRGIFVPWTKMIKERTAAIGKPVEITIFGAGALGKTVDQYDLVVNGLADMAGSFGLSAIAGRFPLNDVMVQPFLFPSATVAAHVAQELFETWPEFRNEFSDTKLLFFHPTGPAQISSRSKPIKTLEDLKGMKANARSGTKAETQKALGLVPVAMVVPEAYTSLERGVLDIGALDWEGAFAFKWFEVTKYRTALPRGLYLTHLAVVMNKNTWNRLPKDVQKIFEELSGRYMAKFSGKAVDKASEHLRELIEKHDKKVGNPPIYELPKGELERWTSAVQPVYDKWTAKMEAKGLPGKAILEDARRLVKKYSRK